MTMTLDNEDQRKVLLAALINAGFPGTSKVLVGAVEMAVRRASIVVPPPPTAPDNSLHGANSAAI